MITIQIRWRSLTAGVLCCALAVAGVVWGLSRARIARDYSASALVLEEHLARAVDYARRAAWAEDAAARRELIGSLLGTTNVGERLVAVLFCYNRTDADPTLEAVHGKVFHLMCGFLEEPTNDDLLQHADQLEAVLTAIRSAKDGDRVDAGKLMRALKGLRFE